MQSLQEFREWAINNKIPIVREQTEKLLIDKIKEINPKKILEIGTAVGYSGTIMLKNSNAVLTTLEIDEERFELAKEKFKEFEVENRVRQVLGDAKEYLKETQEKFDFIFLDGPKSHYVEYLENLIEMLNTNGAIFADNVLFRGLVLSGEEPPKKYRTIVRNLRKFLKQLEKNEKLSTKIYEIEDGISFSTFDKI